MKTTGAAVRRRFAGVLTATALTGATAAVVLVPAATAAPDPCAASEVSKTVGSVAQKTGDYLDKHPETNQAMTSVMQQQPSPQSLAALKAYFDTNPAAQKDMQKLTEPLTDLSTKCKLPISLPQMLGMVQAAQGQGGLPGGPGTQAVVGPPGPGAVPVPAPGPAVVPPNAVR